MQGMAIRANEVFEGEEEIAVVQERELTRFEQADEFQSVLLSEQFYPGSLRPFHRWKEGQRIEDVRPSIEGIDERIRLANAETSLRKLVGIVNEYQEQSYLLDPFLEDVVLPPVRALQSRVRDAFRPSSTTWDEIITSPDVARIAVLIYSYTKVRGFKTILHFFPHAVDDLLPTLSLLESFQHDPPEGIWELRYILLLWLSLICMIPFDLARFDDAGDSEAAENTIVRVVQVGQRYLASPGKERDAASTMLAKLFQRRDAGERHFSNFLRWCQTQLTQRAQPSTFLAMGIMQTLCNVVKLQTPEALSAHVDLLRSILALFSSDEEEAADAAGGSERVLPRQLTSNSIVNKYKAKMACRLAMKMLQPRKRRRVLKAATLGHPAEHRSIASMESGEVKHVDEDEDEDDVPEEIDGYIARLIDALQDKDTVVRYSAAKGLARICCRLPPDFVDQVADEVTSLFAVNVLDLKGKREDLSNVSEFTWQGCCLALAELARRGLLAGDGLDEKLFWVEKALVFDIRRGAHSVGSGVRDAACYVLWALARAHDAEAIRPHAKSLSQTLVCVALLDRDISIRRAASAAFQECVGRLGIFAHGIDVIRKTDFYAVSVRRNAFLDCLPQVAEHEEYRDALVKHLIDTTIVHWDVDMRDLGAQALACVVRQNYGSLGLQVTKQLSANTRQMKDLFTLHGCLTALAEIGANDKDACADDTIVSKCKVIAMATLKHIIKPVSRAPGTAHVLRAACRLIATCAMPLSLEGQAIPWPTFVDSALERQEEVCHDAAAEATATLSRHIDLHARIEETIRNWRRLNVAQQQSNAKVLGSYAYGTPSLNGIIERVLQFLSSLVNEGNSAARSTNIETRRNAMCSIARIAIRVARDDDDDDVDDSVPLHREPLLREVFITLLGGLDDYSTDARGDVGSWVRLACMEGLRELISVERARYLTQELLDQVIAGLAKQMCERIDSVRTEARRCFLFVTRDIHAHAGSSLQMDELLLILFPPSEDESLRASGTLTAKIVRLLAIASVREEVLKGIVLGIGGQRETINRTLSDNLIAFLDEVPRSSSSGYSLVHFFDSLSKLTEANVRANRYFVPCLQTFNVLLEDEVIQIPFTDTLQRILRLALLSIDKVKSVPRILAATQFAINLLRYPALQPIVLDRIPTLLLHPFPTVRASTAGLLYTQAQLSFDATPDEAEEILLSTAWAQESVDDLAPIVKELVDSLRCIL